MEKIFARNIKSRTFVTLKNTVAVAQLVRVLVCGAEGRGFEPHQPPPVGRGLFRRFSSHFFLSVTSAFSAAHSCIKIFLAFDIGIHSIPFFGIKCTIKYLFAFNAGILYNKSSFVNIARFSVLSSASLDWSMAIFSLRYYSHQI